MAGTAVSVALLGVLLTAMSAAVLRAASYFVEACTFGTSASLPYLSSIATILDYDLKEPIYQIRR